MMMNVSSRHWVEGMFIIMPEQEEAIRSSAGKRRYAHREYTMGSAASFWTGPGPVLPRCGPVETDGVS